MIHSGTLHCSACLDCWSISPWNGILSLQFCTRSWLFRWLRILMTWRLEIWWKLTLLICFESSPAYQLMCYWSLWSSSVMWVMRRLRSMCVIWTYWWSVALTQEWLWDCHSINWIWCLKSTWMISLCLKWHYSRFRFCYLASSSMNQFKSSSSNSPVCAWPTTTSMSTARERHPRLTILHLYTNSPFITKVIGFVGPE